VLGRVCFASAMLSGAVPLSTARPHDLSRAGFFNVTGASRSVTETETAESNDPDRLYRNREDLASAKRAAELWAVHAATEFESAWKLSRACYWLGTHAPESERRGALERGVMAGQSATRLETGRPEGHFWLAANMGALAESFGLMQGLRFRRKIKDELERVLAIDPAWQGGSADAALGQWYFEVPVLFGGNHGKAEEHLRRALTYDPHSLVALVFLAEVVAADGRRSEARNLLQRVVLDPSIDSEWLPEDKAFKKQAAERLRSLGK
jgi:hypothetical protein